MDIQCSNQAKIRAEEMIITKWENTPDRNILSNYEYYIEGSILPKENIIICDKDRFYQIKID